MTSRERVLAAVSHREPDQVPVDFGGHRSSGIAASAYARLKKALGIRGGDVYVYDVVQQLAIVEPAVLDSLGVDVVEMGRGFALADSDWKPWALPDGTSCRVPSWVNIERRGRDSWLVSDDGVDLAVQRQGCLYFEQTHTPLAGGTPGRGDLEAALAHTMWTGIGCPGAHLPFDERGLAELTRGARALRASTDRAIIGLFGGNLFEIPQFLHGNQEYLEHMAADPEGCVSLSERLCARHLARLEKWLGAVGPYVDIVLFGDDLGGQNGPLMSPAMYRRYYKPYHRQMWTRAKELADVKVQLHTCGGIEPLLEDLIEAGLDMVNPVQISARGMDAAALKAKYGSRLTLWGGGCDTRSVLSRGTPEQVRAHVSGQLAVLSRGGGFVFQQVHNVLADVPAENVIAMFEAVREFNTRG